MRNSNSTHLSSIICCKQFLSLTKAVHGTACTTSAVGLQVLRSRLAHRDLSKKGAIEQAQLGRASLAPCFYNFNNACDWKDTWFPREARLSLHGGWRRTNVKSTIRKAELSLHSRPASLWAYLGNKLIGVAVQSSSEKLLKRQLYTCERLRRNSNTPNTIFCFC